MKIGIVSDIHATPKALRRALTDMPSVDRILCAGDAISEYQFCPETVEILQQAEVQCIQGNHEWVLFGGGNQHYLRKCEAEYSPEVLSVLATAPTTIELEAEGAKVLMVHACPWSPFDEYITPNSPQLAKFAEQPYDFVILGHTHIPMIHTEGQVTVINPGSCSQSRASDRRGSYAVLDLAQRSVDIHHLSLD